MNAPAPDDEGISVFEKDPVKISTAFTSFLLAVCGVLLATGVISAVWGAIFCGIIAAVDQLIKTLFVRKKTVAIKPLEQYAEAMGRSQDTA